MLSDDMQAFKRVLSESKHIIAVAGAGLSAASGKSSNLQRLKVESALTRVKAYRLSEDLEGSGGGSTRLALLRPGLLNEPRRASGSFTIIGEKPRTASPNTAHHVLAQLSIPSFRKNIAPDSTFTLITQNVDGLSKRALDKVLSGLSEEERATLNQAQPPMFEMHGRLFDVLCSAKKCGHVEWNDVSPICPALAGTETLVDAGVIEPTIAEADLPRCQKCGALARPGVVWFGETPLYLEEIDDLVAKADLCLVVGTSSMVYPAAGYAGYVRSNGGKVAVFNLERSQGDERADFLFLGPCEETLPRALGVDSE